MIPIIVTDATRIIVTVFVDRINKGAIQKNIPNMTTAVNK